MEDEYVILKKEGAVLAVARLNDMASFNDAYRRLGEVNNLGIVTNLEMARYYDALAHYEDPNDIKGLDGLFDDLDDLGDVA
jgi:hypothetical protein